MTMPAFRTGRSSLALLALLIVSMLDAVAAERFDDLRLYEDPEFGFTVLIPSNWTPIVIPEAPDKELDWEPGYAIGFESPRMSLDDDYADYIMIELLPGSESGAFRTDGRERVRFELDGEPAVRDRIHLPAQPFGDATLDLTVYQAEQRGIGYTLGIYAVGESSEADWLSAVFELILATFRKPDEPFSVS